MSVTKYDCVFYRIRFRHKSYEIMRCHSLPYPIQVPAHQTVPMQSDSPHTSLPDSDTHL